MINLSNVTLVCFENSDHRSAVSLINQQLQYAKFGDVRLLNFHHGYDQFIYWETYEVWKYVTTEFAMFIHLDGYIINPEQWQDAFLEYDYIGAPWPEDWPYCTKSENRVGNAGFCIKSAKMMRAIADMPYIKAAGDLITSDVYAAELIQLGMTYAPVTIAAQFSVEHTSYGIKEPFGFHGEFGQHEKARRWKG